MSEPKSPPVADSPKKRGRSKAATSSTPTTAAPSENSESTRKLRPKNPAKWSRQPTPATPELASKKPVPSAVPGDASQTAAPATTNTNTAGAQTAPPSQGSSNQQPAPQHQGQKQHGGGSHRKFEHRGDRNDNRDRGNSGGGSGGDEDHSHNRDRGSGGGGGSNKFSGQHRGGSPRRDFRGDRNERNDGIDRGDNRQERGQNRNNGPYSGLPQDDFGSYGQAGLDDPNLAISPVSDVDLADIQLTDEEKSWLSSRDLKTKNIAELTELALKLKIENAGGLRRQDMIFEILKRAAKLGVDIYGSGVLEICPMDMDF